MAFDKFRANEYIRSLGFFAQKSVVLKITDPKRTIVSKVNKFWREEKIKRCIINPASGGSSIGVFSVENTKAAIQSIETLFSKRMDTRIVLLNRFNMPVAILPT